MYPISVMAILYYLLIKPLSLLPWRALYFISDCLYWIVYKLFKYRTQVVNANLRNSLPDRTTKEIAEIRDRFYHHFFDIIIESIKLFSARSEEIMDRMEVTNPELLDTYYAQGRDLVICGGHYSNWEYVTHAFPPRVKHQMSAIYHQLKNKFFEKIILESRSRGGTLMVSRKQTRDGYYDTVTEPIGIIFGTDQSPSIAKKVYWTTFLGQETAVAFGAEKFAKERNAVVIWGDNEKLGRGKFSVTFKVLTESPVDEPHGRISELHVAALEKQILKAPAYWLWTHKRWKRKRKPGEE